MDRLDETFHDIHHKLSIGGDQFASGCEYRWRIEGVYWEGVPTISSLATKPQIDRQCAGVDLACCQRGINPIEFN